MQFLQNIPYMLALFCALIVSTIGLVQNVPFKSLCIRVSFVGIIFFMLGLIIRKILVDIVLEIEEKIRQDEIARLDEQGDEFSQSDPNHPNVQTVKNDDFEEYDFQDLEQLLNSSNKRTENKINKFDEGNAAKAVSSMIKKDS